MKRLRAWGVPREKANWSEGWNCPRCHFDFFPPNDEQHLVGFATIPSLGKEPPDAKKYIIIVECPDCHKKYWWHITGHHAARLAFTNNWPQT